MFDLNEPSDSVDLIGSELLNSNGDIAGSGASCAQPLGKRDDLFDPDLLLSIIVPR